MLVTHWNMKKCKECTSGLMDFKFCLELESPTRNILKLMTVAHSVMNHCRSWTVLRQRLLLRICCNTNNYASVNSHTIFESSLDSVEAQLCFHRNVEVSSQLRYLQKMVLKYRWNRLQSSTFPIVVAKAA